MSKSELKTTEIEMHEGVHKVVDYMYRNLQADELRGVANAVAELAPSIWSNHPEKEVRTIKQRYKINEPELIVGSDNELP